MGIKKKNTICLEDILTDQPEEENLLEIPLAERVFKGVRVVVFLLAAAVIFQLAFVNIVKGDFYEMRSVANMSEARVRFAPRGAILDRFGKPLLFNEPATRVSLSPIDFPKNPEERITVLSEIGEVLGIGEGELYKKISERDWGQSDRILLKENVTHGELVAISSANLPGVFIEPGYRRVHESPFVFSHILGYTGLVNKNDFQRDDFLYIDDVIGRAGLEAFYDAELRGKNGKEVFFRNAIGKVEEREFIEEPTPGKLIETFIDREFQKYIYSRLNQGLSELGRSVGVVIAMNPKNGEILSFASIPSFDSSSISDFLSSKDQPFFNRGISGRYNPGSTIKPLVALAALSERVIAPERQIYSKGFIEIPNPFFPDRPSRFLDWRPNGWVDVKSALAKSSNIYFYEVTGGYEDQRGIGIEKLKGWWQKFLFDKKTGIDIIGENEGFLPDPKWKLEKTGDVWRIGDTYNVSIGQGDFLVTPIGLLNYTSAIANGGVLYKPRIMKKIQGASNEESVYSEAEVLADLREELGETIFYVREGMRDVVEKPYGTAHSLSLLPFPVSAKTGTAQVFNNERINAFFVGYAPSSNPEIAVLVLVENAREGSSNTIPIARDILLWYYENRLK